jgi:hypothetical protein
MMKKLLIFMLVLGMASLSQGALKLQINGADVYTASTAGGETVTVTLVGTNYLTAGVDFMTLVEATDVSVFTTGDGIAVQANAVANIGGSVGGTPTSTVMNVSNSGYLDNYNGVLFDYWQAYNTDGAPAGTLATFQYTLPTGDPGEAYWLSALIAGVDYEYEASGWATSETAQGPQIIGGAPVNVLIDAALIIPEPATIALLGLGALLLKRRK